MEAGTRFRGKCAYESKGLGRYFCTNKKTFMILHALIAAKS
ncbi:hypothetical protein SPHINGO8BC_20066 [Sphingobacterium multivorum]|uniref:Uncharacterized protein n=1 Tax=Sphingobacterium multivorum TaxID=28454 RepID=A0A654BBY4_SPHMU|nr:hypothetical protein SPHINGO8BC_20066 [Sphingobacterium multivorum]